MSGLTAAAFTTERVMRLTGVSRRRLSYWLDRGIVDADIDEARGRGHVRLWSFTNLLEVRVALSLRERISLQLLGKVVRALRRRGYSTPLADVRVVVIGYGSKPDRVVVQDHDGAWQEPLSGQVVMELVLPLTRFREELSDAIQQDRRQQRAAGQVVRQRGRLGSTPVFAGTRVPVAAVRRLREAGWGTDRILAEFPGLTQADVMAATRPDTSQAAGL